MLYKTMMDCTETPRDIIGCIMVNYIISLISYFESVSVTSLIDTIYNLHWCYRYFITIFLYSISLILLNILMFNIKDLVIDSFKIFVKILSNTWVIIKICTISFINYKLMTLLYQLRTHNELI